MQVAESTEAILGAIVIDREGTVVACTPPFDTSTTVGSHWASALESHAFPPEIGAAVRAYPLPLAPGGMLGGKVIVVAAPRAPGGDLAPSVATGDSNLALAEVVAGVAHEINNPLTYILGAVQLMQLDAPQDFREQLDLIEKETERIASLARSLLHLRDRGDTNRRPVSLQGVVADMVRLVRYQMHSDNIRIACNVPDDLPAVCGVEEQLKQVCLNLLVNARQAIRGPGRITVSGRHAEGVVELRFRDTGTGIAEKSRDRLFEPGFSTGRGAGIGLFLCKRIVEGHGGEIRVDSRPGEGTEVVLRFPANAGGGA